MPGPWDKYAQPQATPAGPWQKYASPTEDITPPPPTDDRNDLQKAFDGATEHMPYVPVHSAGDVFTNIGHAAGNFAGGLLEPLTPLVHPQKTMDVFAANTQNAPQESAGDVALQALGPAGPLIGDLVKRIGRGEGAEGLGNLATTMMVPEEGEAALAKIPSKARAGAIFESVMNDAADQPVNMTRSMDPLERIQQLSERGGTGVKAADQLYKRINTVNPLNYREARDFASNISRLSAAEKMGLSPTMKAEIGRLSKTFNQDIGDAAGAVGRGEDYANAMKEYASGARLSNFLDNAKKAAIPIAAGAAGIGGLHRLLRAFE